MLHEKGDQAGIQVAVSGKKSYSAMIAAGSATGQASLLGETTGVDYDPQECQ